jgi:hypothetical protein
LKLYRAAIKIDDFLIADFKTSYVLHHKVSGQVHLFAPAAYFLLCAFPSFALSQPGKSQSEVLSNLNAFNEKDLEQAFHQLCKSGYLVES